ncbi:MAG TPA: tetratricopeptide repeat protein [Candidatus Acidoferrum sp.]|jgi:tetratricopeptide (TPR) repeat protein
MKQGFHGLHLSFLFFSSSFFCLNAGALLADEAGLPAYQLPAEANAFQRGLSALKENRIDDALAELTEAEREHPDDALVRNFRGIALVRLGKNAEAEREYHEAIRRNPMLEDAYRNLGFLEWNEHQLEPAREALQRAVELSPSDSFGHYYLGRVQLDAQRYAPAIRELEISHVPLPADGGFLIQLATGYVAVGRNDDARKSLEHLAATPLTEGQSVHVASLYLGIHENDLAVGMIQRLKPRASSLEDGWRQFDLALVYLLSGNYGKAIGQADRCNQSVSHGDPKRESAEAWTVLGIAAARLNQRERSANALRHSVALAPTQEENWLNLTRELMEMNRYAEAITSVQDGIASNPKSYALHLRLGAAQLAAGHYTEAESVFLELVAAGDPLPTGYVGLAQALMRTGRAEEAASELAAASQKLGPNFLLSYFRGLALDRAGKPVEAMAAFQEAAALNADNAEVHLNVGKLELGSGRVDEAIVQLEEALRLDASNEQAKRLLSKAYTRAGDAKRAAAFAEASNDNPTNTVEGDENLLGDFFVPQWQMPPESPTP